MMKSIGLVLMALLTWSSVAEAGKIKLGDVQLMDRKDRDVLNLPLCKSSSNDRVTKLQVVVTRYQAEIDRLKVVFHNGEEQLLQVRDTFNAGTTSRWIDMSGSARCIKQIVIIGDTNTRRRRPRKQAQVAFWGMTVDPPPPPPPPPVARVAAEGVVLGRVSLTDAKDRDVINLPPCATSDNIAVNQVQLAVRGHKAEIDRFRVFFQNGEQQELSVKDHFEPGTTSRWIDLAGAARCIDRIVIIGDTDSVGRRPGKQATIVVRGLARSTKPAPNPPVNTPARPAAAANAIRLGQVSLTDAKDRDVVNLPACKTSTNVRVTALQMEVLRFQAEIDKFRVVFQNGEDQILSVRNTFKAGTRSRWIALEGAARCIDKIIVIGDTNSIGRRPGKQATVVFYGK